MCIMDELCILAYLYMKKHCVLLGFILYVRLYAYQNLYRTHSKIFYKNIY